MRYVSVETAHMIALVLKIWVLRWGYMSWTVFISTRCCGFTLQQFHWLYVQTKSYTCSPVEMNYILHYVKCYATKANRGLITIRRISRNRGCSRIKLHKPNLFNWQFSEKSQSATIRIKISIKNQMQAHRSILFLILNAVLIIIFYAKRLLNSEKTMLGWPFLDSIHTHSLTCQHTTHAGHCITTIILYCCKIIKLFN